MSGNIFEEMMKSLQEFVKTELEKQVKEEVTNQIQSMFREGQRNLGTLNGRRKAQKSVKAKSWQSLSEDSKNLYRYLAHFRTVAGDEDATPTYEDIGKALGMNTVKASNSYKELVEKGLIERIPQGRRRIVRFKEENLSISL
jgi:Fic family protein